MERERKEAPEDENAKVLMFSKEDVKSEKRPDDVSTVHEMERDYGIDRRKIYRAIKKRNLNGVKVGYEDDGGVCVVQKWYIEKDALYEKFIEDDKAKMKKTEGLLHYRWDNKIQDYVLVTGK